MKPIRPDVEQWIWRGFIAATRGYGAFAPEALPSLSIYFKAWHYGHHAGHVCCKRPDNPWKGEYPMNHQIKTELYLGRAIAGRPDVSDEAFAEFLRLYVGLRGYTVLQGQGMWEGKPEPVSILVVIHNGTTQEFFQLDAIASAYRRQFAQESVLRVDTVVSSQLR